MEPKLWTLSLVFALSSLYGMDSNIVAVAMPVDSGKGSLELLYEHAEMYVAAYCEQKGLDPKAEEKKWLKKWQESCQQAISDNTDSSEQSYINRMVLQKRDCFDTEKADADKIVEGCRILLRYRDAELYFLQAMKDALSEPVTVRKLVSFLAEGPRPVKKSD